MASKLISVDYYCAAKQMNADAANVQTIEAAIEAASQMAVQLAGGREFFKPSTAYSEYFHGSGFNRYYVRHGRILNTTSSPVAAVAPLLYEWNGGTAGTTADWTASTALWSYNVDDGYLWMTDGAVFTRSSEELPYWKVVYYYGWDQTTMPADVKLACADMSAFLLKAMEHAGVSTEAFTTSTTTYMQRVPEWVAEILNRYRVIYCD